MCLTSSQLNSICSIFVLGILHYDVFVPSRIEFCFNGLTILISEFYFLSSR